MTKRPKSRYQRKLEDKQEVEHHFTILPKNQKQDLLIHSIKSYPITVTTGCAGTGKTYCSIGTAAALYKSGRYKKIVLARANVPTGKSLGSFPGDIKEKLTPWLMPMLDVLKKAFGPGKFAYMIEKELIEMQPIETIRGRSYENTVVLVDEAQNLTFDDLKAISTRLGENSKLVLMGDPAQSDVKKGQDLLMFCKIVERGGIDVPIITFGANDIVRSDIVASLVKLFLKEGV